MSKGVLVDITQCIGCGSCSVACKMWNDLGFEAAQPNPPKNRKLSDKNWTVVDTCETHDKSGEEVWRYVKKQCMHCQEPACASACFSKALQRNDDGAVVYYPDLCVGCRYCMIACPFDVPKYEWSKAAPQIAKCQMCSTRLAKGESPACTSVCPTHAVLFGERDELLAIAQKRINSNPQYQQQIYGREEVGGTAWLYLSDVPFGELGFKTNLQTTPLPEYTHRFLKHIPYVALAWGGLLTALSLFNKRRRRIRQENEEAAAKKGSDRRDA